MERFGSAAFFRIAVRGWQEEREVGIYRVVRATQDIEAVVIASRVRTEGMYLDIHPAPQSVKCASGNGVFV